MHNSGGSSYLGSTAAPFVVESDPALPNFAVPDLAPPLAIDAKRFGSRRSLLATVDRFQKRGEVKFNAQASSSMTISDNSGSYTLTANNGKKRFKAKDADGVELFDGPVDTDEQRDGLDRDLIKKLEQLEGNGNVGF